MLVKTLVDIVHEVYLVTWVVLLLSAQTTISADPTDISRLRSDLLTGYHKSSFPDQGGKNNTALKFGFTLQSYELDEVRSTLTLDGLTSLEWEDHHFKWDPQNYGNLTVLHMNADEIWKPDLAVYNTLANVVDYFRNTRIILNNTGNLFFVPPTQYQAQCYIDLEKWPYDTQNCTIGIASWSHSGVDLNIILDNNTYTVQNSTMDLGYNWNLNLEWALISNKMTRGVTDYGDEYKFVWVDLRLIITRRSVGHTLGYISPALAIATGTLISFWLRPKARERVLMIMVNILINALYLSELHSVLFSNGDKVPLVLLFYRDSLIMNSVALVWTLCLQHLSSTQRTASLPPALSAFLKGWMARILCLSPGSAPGFSLSDYTEEDDEGKLVEPISGIQGDWAWMASILDRLAFLLYALIYLAFYFVFL